MDIAGLPARDSRHGRFVFDDFNPRQGDCSVQDRLHRTRAAARWPCRRPGLNERSAASTEGTSAQGGAQGAGVAAGYNNGALSRCRIARRYSRAQLSMILGAESSARMCSDAARLWPFNRSPQLPRRPYEHAHPRRGRGLSEDAPRRGALQGQARLDPSLQTRAAMGFHRR